MEICGPGFSASTSMRMRLSSSKRVNAGPFACSYIMALGWPLLSRMPIEGPLALSIPNKMPALSFGYLRTRFGESAFWGSGARRPITRPDGFTRSNSRAAIAFASTRKTLSHCGCIQPRGSSGGEANYRKKCNGAPYPDLAFNLCETRKKIRLRHLEVPPYGDQSEHCQRNRRRITRRGRWGTLRINGLIQFLHLRLRRNPPFLGTIVCRFWRMKRTLTRPIKRWSEGRIGSIDLISSVKVSAYLAFHNPMFCFCHKRFLSSPVAGNFAWDCLTAVALVISNPKTFLFASSF
jgi:hypothetical protein